MADFADRQRSHRRERTRVGGLVGEVMFRPIHLVGLRPIWGAAADRGPCIGCGGRPLELLEVCVRCDRSGLDHSIPAIRRKAATAAVEPKRKLAGGLGARRRSG
ncbi:hypothetical protein P12x_003451 [Tundrisphaera lichenicola]|uniref:hypothetical protein n=1 Tax=Tundrisphaera lichenicola TaxID=2029860 RepID=UPI003EC0C79E